MRFDSAESLASSTSARRPRARAALLAAILTTACSLVAATGASAAPVTGAIFTTDAACLSVNLNVGYADAQAVYLNGGPAHTGAAGLPDGTYYVQVTEPDGTVLGSSGADRPVTVSGGEFAACYQLWSIVFKTSDASQGYDATTNPGGEYKVWVSTDATFVNSETKTDNFKVRAADPCDPEVEECGGGDPSSATLNVRKFYDANANGLDDDGQDIDGWEFSVVDGMSFYGLLTPLSLLVDAPDVYTVTESDALEATWSHTTTNPVIVDAADGGTYEVAFGNVCVGAGGGHTLGFWSNKNGLALVGGDDLAMLTALNLRNGAGASFDPANNAALKSWLLAGSATNMAYMLSVQLAAMELNVLNGFASGGALIYAPGATSANALGFTTVDALMAEADASLATDNVTIASGAARAYQEALKTALDRGNNNLNFVQATPCAFSFAPIG
jgi:hypothetical protein